MYEIELLERDDLVKQQKADVISKSLVIDVLSNEQQLALVLSNVSQYLAGEVSFVKARIGDVEKPADLERLDAVRKSIAKWRVDSGKNYAAMKKASKDLIAKADDGFELVVSAQKNAESEIEQALSDKKQEFEQEKLRKKAISEALAKLKSHVINPLLPSADIETAIDDFALAFGGSDYQESQADAEAIFEIKKSQFDEILSAAVVREENERKVKEQEEQARQRANIAVTFPLAEISGYAARSSVDIQSRIDWTDKVDMTAFELVLDEAKIAKQSCLNMLAAFLPMAEAREAKEVADKAELKRITEIKAMIKNIADRPSDFIGKPSADILKALSIAKEEGIGSVWNGDFAEFKNEAELTLADAIERLTIILDGTLKKEADDAANEVKEHIDSIPVYKVSHQRYADNHRDERQAQESAVIAIISGDAEFVEEVAKIIGEPCFQQSNPELSESALNGGSGEPSQDDYEAWEAEQPLEVIEVVSETVANDCVLIPVKYLKALICIAQQFDDGIYDANEIDAIEFAKSLI